MLVDTDNFTDEQKARLAGIVSDFGGPTSTANILVTLERALWEIDPDWEHKNIAPDLKADIEVCFAALQYLKVQDIVDAVEKR